MIENTQTTPAPSSFGPKQVIAAFLVVLVSYLGVYHWIEYRRHVKGPWEVEFSVDAQGTPAVQIRQPSLKIDRIIQFAGEHTTATNLPQSLLLDEPGRIPPFGRIIYEDLTFLPGVVTLDLFGHEVELLPRVLFLNKKEKSWSEASVIVVSPEEKPAVAPAPPQGGTRDSAH